MAMAAAEAVTSPAEDALVDGDVDGAAPGTEPAKESHAESITPLQLVAHFRDIVPLLLGGTGLELTTALTAPQNSPELTRFLEDPQQCILTISRAFAKDDDDEKDLGVFAHGANGLAAPVLPYTARVSPDFTSNKQSSVVFVKRDAQITVDKPIQQQLGLISLEDSAPFETVHNYLSRAIGPYIKTAATSQRGDDATAKTMTRSLAELEAALQHLQQTFEIPEINIPIHPYIRQLLQRAQDEGREIVEADYADRRDDMPLMDALQKLVLRWIREIQKVTVLERDPPTGTTMQEVSFWVNLDRALLHIRDRRNSPEVQLTVEVLKFGKRLIVTTSLDSDTGLQKALEAVTSYMPLMKDFPPVLSGLVMAQDLDAVRVGVVEVFNHLKKIKHTNFPVSRVHGLLQSIWRDMNAQMLKLLRGLHLLHASYDDFEVVINQCKRIFATWDEEDDRFRVVLRELMQRKRDDNVRYVPRITPEQKALRLRIEELGSFRHQHELLRTVIGRVLRAGEGAAGEVMLDEKDAKAIDEVEIAYDEVKSADVLDFSEAGNQAWDSVKKKYEERIDRVEERIIEKLKGQLDTAKNASSMFRIFSKFNSLFVRPRIRVAVRAYQGPLIQSVKHDIDELHEKFKVQYTRTMNCKMSDVRDIPPVSAQIIWARQISNQLDGFTKHVEDVLGHGWEQQPDGRALKEDFDSFRLKLDTQVLFDRWSAEVQARQMGVAGRIFDIELRRGMETALVMSVNFHPQLITLAKEVRNLKWLGFRVPLVIVNKAVQANNAYPSAVSMKASIRTYQQTLDKLKANEGMRPLLAGYHRSVQAKVAEGVQLRWESYRLDQYVKEFSEEVFTFQEKMDDLLEFSKKLHKTIKRLDKCKMDHATVSEIIKEIQKIVDDLTLRNYANLDDWVLQVDRRVEEKLIKRLQYVVQTWMVAVDIMGKDLDPSWDPRDTGLTIEDINVADLPAISISNHKIAMRNQVMFLEPPLEAARENLMLDLQRHLAMVVDQPRIRTSQYLAAQDEETKSSLTYRSILRRLPERGRIVTRAYEVIEARLASVETYMKSWLQYQALWDLQTEAIVKPLGDDLNQWQELVVEIKKTRRTFDTPDTSKRFGPVEINYEVVQTRVGLKYDQLHKEILTKFASRLNTSMTSFFTNLQRAKKELEDRSVDSANTEEAVGVISAVQDLKKRSANWTEQVALFQAGQKILEKQRYGFPSDWLYADNIEAEWGAFSEILGKRSGSIQSQVGVLRDKVVEKDRQLQRRIADTVGEWDTNKPVGGDVNPDQANSTLAIYEARLTKLHEEFESMQRTKQALDIPVTAEDALAPRLEELRDLKASWSELSRIWSNIGELKQLSWPTVVPSQIKAKLEDLLQQCANMPTRVRSYASYEYTVTTLNGLIKINSYVAALKSDAIKERHWVDLKKALNVTFDVKSMTLGNIWDADLLKNDKAVKSIIDTAQGEMALEVFLKQTREEWQDYEVEIVPYTNKTTKQVKTFLLKGFDNLFTKCRERISSLNQMKASPYYKFFADEAGTWDEKLNRVNVIFEVWMDVQRRWVDLEGIFTGSADIKQQLSGETAKFESLSTEFEGLMKKVHKNPLVMEIINIPNCQKSLERLAEILTKIQKALGEYLERQRSAFPRFYFVGDEDLLEIIGNSKDVEKLQKHFRKMFAGVHEVIVTEDKGTIIGCKAKEGEEIHFKEHVKLAGQAINIWLTGLESEVRSTLAKLLAESVGKISEFAATGFKVDKYLDWMDQYQAQLVVLSAQVFWSEAVDAALNGTDSAPDKLKGVLKTVEETLTALADTVLLFQPPVRRKKLEQLITELVHQRDVTRDLLGKGIKSNKAFEWLSQMRFYFNTKITNPLEQLTIKVANADCFYGFEYLGLTEKLVQTPLTDKAYMTLTQGLKARQGGAPFGPAGTGKTESVKALGAQLGRFVLVFNCDEAFDAEAMKRILVGLCQVGAWGCFDEFNRLDETQLSAVSQQIQTVQLGLREMAAKKERVQIELIAGQRFTLHPDVGAFVTMNPGYAGRSNLPDNLKKLFRNLAMTKPDRQLIAQVMLYSQGFRTAERLSKKIVPLFVLCDEQLSAQSHYDFGLRSLKSVLVSAGNIKRDQLAAAREAMREAGGPLDEEKIAASIDEQNVLIQSVSETMIPKLVADDIPLLSSLLNDVFPGFQYTANPMRDLRAKIEEVAAERHLIITDTFMLKMLQLYQVTNINHGLMLVGPAGSGKTAAWTVLLEALRRWEGKDAHAYVIDPKAITKDELYGFLDPTTREWTDGIFTHLVRKVIDNRMGELDKRQWIIFDGDVDPEWVENLNSVLDDNKLLTLPNGERLSLPKNIRIIFEVQDLKNATLATVSRCGMIWFSEDVLDLDMHCQRFLRELRSVSLDPEESNAAAALAVQRQVADLLAPYLAAGGLVEQALQLGSKLEHVMVYTHSRAVNALFCMLRNIASRVIQYNKDNEDSPMKDQHLDNFVSKRLVYDLMWSLVGDAKGTIRDELSALLRKVVRVELPPESEGVIIDFEVSDEGEWVPWKHKVATKEVDTDNMAGTDVVVDTIDTVRHVDILYKWLGDHLPVVLCGPPGSGKTMTLMSALAQLPGMQLELLNFSSTTTPDLIMNTFNQYCEYRKTPAGTVLAPIQVNKWLVVFCDECNLPAADKYSTVHVITFLRQLIEQNGFWRNEKHDWVTLERIQFVGACNPPSDPGRVPLSLRLLRHVPVVYVDYPSPESYRQIYGTFVRGILRKFPELFKLAEAMTWAMVDFFNQSQKRFTADMQPFYIYSPRELTRWFKGIREAIKESMKGDGLTQEGLVRIWAHEALRLFQDRLVHDDERKWTDETLDSVAATHFTMVDTKAALRRPILYTSWPDRFHPVERDELRAFVQGRLKVFLEEELDVKLVLFNEVLDHVLRIDRVYRQNQGHLLLIGISGGGKTTLAKFVAWINKMSVFQVKSHNRYTAKDFDEDLRGVLKRSGIKGEKIVYILDEGGITDTAFLERMNTLLANGEVPGLFDGDEYASLMSQCKDAARKAGTMLDGNEELYKWFCGQVMKNLHVVFTMNPAEGGMQDRASTSPALFNRCVLDWYGDWSDMALYQVAREFTAEVPLDKAGYAAPATFQKVLEDLPTPPDHRNAVLNAFIYVHKSVKAASRKMAKREGRTTHITPRHFVECVNQFIKIQHEKRTDLEEQQQHLNAGLKKMKETVDEVEKMQKSLAVKGKELEAKNEMANVKLQQMVKDQKVAEDKKVQSEALSKQLVVKVAAAQEKKKAVEDELMSVEPAVRKAEEAVSKIGKKELKEIQALQKPPQTVRLVCEAVCALLGEGDKATDWKNVRAIMLQDDFVTRVKTLNSEKVPEKTRAMVEAKYVKSEDFTEEKAYRASQAAGPLCVWVQAQVKFIGMLLNIEPLRNQLKQLETDARTMQQQSDEANALVKELEKSIERYKEEYAALISEAQAIKNETATVKSKVDRSVLLLKSLESERDRWSKSSEQFGTQMSTIIGDSLVCGAFLGYAGYFNQVYRSTLLASWWSHLSKAMVEFEPGMKIAETLSTADERLRWKGNNLPADDMCTENAIMLKRFQRFPLIIDPAGQATAFLMAENTKMEKTSFLEPNFRKKLEGALRFGTQLLVQDAEAYDPILNPVLNRETRKQNSRVLVTIGDQDIDLSPSFSIMLTTRNPTFQFRPDLCSRVTMVNFTITRVSLQTQCLSKALRSERPDVDKKRSDLLKLQGEFRVKLQQLEKSLLKSLNEAKGSLLDDETVITKLQTIKKEAAEVQAKSEESGRVLEDIETTSKEYLPLSVRCSAIFFTLEQMQLVHFLYKFSLKFFMDIFDVVLTQNDHLKGKTDYAERLAIINQDLFAVTFARVSPGMMQEDRLALAMTFARLYLHGTKHNPPADELAFFLGGGGDSSTEMGDFASLVPTLLTPQQAGAAHALSVTVGTFRGLARDLQARRKEVLEWLHNNRPEETTLNVGEPSGDSGIVNSFRQMLLIQAFRPDRILAKLGSFVDQVLGEGFAAERSNRLVETVEKEVDSRTPLLLCGVSGYDASTDVFDLAISKNKDLKQYAMGSAEGFKQAEEAIDKESKAGGWVMVKNVHLVPSWLVTMEKTLAQSTPHADFRLFLTSEVNPKLPANLLRSSRIFVYEPAAGVKANLLRTLNSFPPEHMHKAPAERSKLYLLLAWLHAVMQERLRYAPLGWSKKYEFGEPDLRAALETIDQWMDEEGKGRANLPADKIPWDALRTLIAQAIYGGRVDNEIDSRLLSSFVGTIFNASSFDHAHALVKAEEGSEAILMPEGTKRDQFITWASSLPKAQLPTWLGLPNNAEKVLLTTRARALLSVTLKLQTTDDEDVSAAGGQTDITQEDGASSGPTWMKTLMAQCTKWLTLLPERIPTLQRTAEAIKDPLFRFFDREINIANRLVKVVRRDVQHVISACNGEVKLTNDVRKLNDDLVKGLVPKGWNLYKVPGTISTNTWVNDFAERVKQFQRLAEHALSGRDFRSASVWLGGLFVPEAYLTATRQAVAQAHGWSLEQLRLELDVRKDEGTPPLDKTSFHLLNLRIEGASCLGDTLGLTQEMVTSPPSTVLKWANAPEPKIKPEERVELPIYLNSTRANLIITVDLRAPPGTTQHNFYERGVAVVCSALGS